MIQDPGVAYYIVNNPGSSTQLAFTGTPSVGTGNIAVIYRQFINASLGVSANSITAQSIAANTIQAYHLSSGLLNPIVNTFIGDNITTSFTLSQPALSANSCLVTVNGITQNYPVNYSVNGTTLTFTSAPATSSVIRCSQQSIISTGVVPIDGSITTSKYAANSIPTSAFVANTIPTNAHIPNSITANLIASVSNTSIVGLLQSGQIGSVSNTSIVGTLGTANGGTGLTSLTAGYIPYGNGTSAFGSSSNLFWDSTNNRLGIGTSSPSWPLQVQTSASDAQIYLTSTGTNNSGQYIANGNGAGSYPAYNLYQSGTNYWSFMMRADTNLYLQRQSGSGNVYIPSGSLNLTSGTAIYNSSGRPMVNQTGGVLQVISTAKTDVFSSTSTTYVAITGLSVTITPSSTSSKILIMCSLNGGSSPSNILVAIRLMQNSTAINLGNSAASYTQATIGGLRSVYDTNGGFNTTINYLDSPATTSAVTYSIQGYSESGSWNINANGSNASGSIWSYRSVSNITVMEIAG